MPELQVNASNELSVQILHVRGQRVLLDSQLAALYEVSTKRLNEQIRRNIDRFPNDFILRLTNQDIAALRSQIATLESGPGKHRKYPPIAFTEHGAIMEALERSVAELDTDTRKQFDQVYEAILGLMSPAAKRQ